MDQKQLAIDAIKKKLVGKPLNSQEIYAIMDEIASTRLGPVLTAYFAAAAFKEGFSDEELYALTDAMVNTGPRLHFDGVVADKHSMGGVPGGRLSMILVPIIASCGFKIPKSSSRAITSPSGTADTMEVLCPVNFDLDGMKKIVDRAGGCIVWGGMLGIAPADDVMITVEEPIGFESYDKMLVSIMAKKIAAGATHVVFDVPIGKTMKIHHTEDGERIKQKLSMLAEKFDMHISVDINEIEEPTGFGIGPVLEARDVLLVLEQHPNRPLHLEEKALHLAGLLLDLCFKQQPDQSGRSGETVAKESLQSGAALKKMKEIIEFQGGNPSVTSEHLAPGKEKYEVVATSGGMITSINNQGINAICRILGCPQDKEAGMALHTRVGESVGKGDILCTLYTSDRWRLTEAQATITNVPIFEIR